jgi:signal transduction histidine kinase
MPNSFRLHYTYTAIGVLTLMACVVLVGVYRARVAEFADYHRNFARGAVAEVAGQFAFLLTERQRQVALFAEDHEELLARLIHEPDNDALNAKVAQQLRRTFPDYFAFVLTDTAGEPYWADYDGYVGEICVQDIRAFAASHENQVRVHPNPIEYHYDAMARWQTAAHEERLLMVSFKPDQLVQKLRSVKVPGHDLMLLLSDGSNTIEVTTAGVRTVLKRDDYRMTPEEVERIVYRQGVRGSRWDLADLFEPGFVAGYRRHLAMDMFLLLAMFLMVAGVAAMLIRREEAARRRAEEARTELMATVTHELRTPLTSLVGSLGLLAGGALGTLPEKARELVDLMNRSAERLRRLVDDLLEARRLDSGQLHLERQPVELTALVDDALAQNAAYGERLGVRFERHDDQGPVWVTADPIRLHQVMANLLSNAAKFSPTGSSVQVRIAPAAPGRVRVSIRDHGAGIRDDLRPQIFSRYVQDGDTVTKAVAGSGLGLSIVKTLVELHDGLVGFDSAVGQGSTFFFELPIRAGSQPA